MVYEDSADDGKDLVKICYTEQSEKVHLTYLDWAAEFQASDAEGENTQYSHG